MHLAPGSVAVVYTAAVLSDARLLLFFRAVNPQAVHHSDTRVLSLGDFARIVGNQTRHQKTKPYTPRHDGKVERCQRILGEELQ
ncbi:hypothetical protein AB0M34_21360 [Nocardia sp. NPDC050193]